MGRAKGLPGQTPAVASFDEVLGARRGLPADENAARDEREEAASRELLLKDPATRRAELVIPREEPERPVLICHRDPEWEDNIIADDDLHVIDVDLGRSFDGIDNIVQSLGEVEAQEWVTDMAEQVADLPEKSAVRQELCGLLDQTGLPYKLTPTGIPPTGIPVLIIRDPDSANQFTSDEPIDVVYLDIDDRDVRDMGESDWQAFCDEHWENLAHLDPDHPQRQALLGLLDDLRNC